MHSKVCFLEECQECLVFTVCCHYLSVDSKKWEWPLECFVGFVMEGMVKLASSSKVNAGSLVLLQATDFSVVGWWLLLFFMTGDGAIVSWTEKAKWQGKIGFCMLMLDREFFDAKPIARLISERRCWFCCVRTEKKYQNESKENS